jgi:methylenetetrahydrofolate dehydrogenase (NADP+)/methenyltetrahydrofolate cyclohydrolase
MVMLSEYGIELKGKEAVVIGRSEIVGKPMSMLLLAEHATVTICHSRTTDLAAHTRRADVLVSAVGRPGFVTPDMVKPGATVIDVGVNRTEAGLVGDVDPAVFDVAGLMTPVPGGVGPMTIAMLLRNTLTASQHRRSKVALPGS